MIILQRIKKFEQMGLGLFVHFGLYSVHKKGEWAKQCLGMDEQVYYSAKEHFFPRKDWAQRITGIAKAAGCRYITMTTRHHDGYSLYNTCGLSDLDTVHDFGRDLVQEFVEACCANGLVPFFYHTLLDWHDERYQTDFSAYLEYLQRSVELLCQNYGSIGGFWFDGMWDKPEADWEEDRLYEMIRRYQPEAILINNTGLFEQGKLGNIELDSVTFERGKPQAINLETSPKYIASEMCEVIGDHWGYAEEDLNFKSPARIIEELCECRKSGANFLLNIGPMADGSIRSIDYAVLELLSEWMKLNSEAVYEPRPSEIRVSGDHRDFVLQKGNIFYLFCFGLGMSADKNVALHTMKKKDICIVLPGKVCSAVWVDNNENVELKQENGCVHVRRTPFSYGRNLVVRIAKIVVCEKSNLLN